MSTHEKEENPLRQQKPPCHEMRMKLVIYELRDFFGDEVGQHLRVFLMFIFHQPITLQKNK